MINRIKRITKLNQIVGILFFTLAIQVIVLIINSITAAKFGTDIGLDSFNLSKNISNFVFGLVGTAITTVVIPNLSKNSSGDKGVNIFITFIYSILTLILLIIFIFKKYLILTIVGEKTNDFISLTEIILNIVMTSYYILSFSNILIAIYQIKNRFNFIKIVQLISNIIVLVLLYFFKEISIIQYTIFIAIGNMLNLLIFLFDYKNWGYKYRFSLDLENEDFRIMLKNLTPILFAAGLYQLSLIIDTLLASRSGEGVLSLLSYSINIVGMINTLFVGNLVMYIYPKLAASIQKKDDSSKQLFYDYSLFIIALMSLLVVGFLVVGRDLISILLERGKFTSKETNIVYIATSLYIISLPFSAVRDITYRYFYSNHDTKTPFLNSVKTTILNVILSVILAKYFGLNGIILGTTISSVCSTILIKIKLNQEFQINLLKKYIKQLNKIAVTSTFGFFMGKMIFNLLENNNIFVRIGITGISIVIFYFLVLIILKFNLLINLKKR